MVWNDGMNTAELLTDAFTRISETSRGAVEGVPDETLLLRLDPDANSISWLVWHLARNQDDHLADAFDGDQVWTAQGFAARFDLPFTTTATGYGQSSQDVAAVRASAELLLEYCDAVHTATLGYLSGLTDADLDRIVDTNWDPPVTLGVRLISVIADGLQHAGQAAYIRGIAERR